MFNQLMTAIEANDLEEIKELSELLNPFNDRYHNAILHKAINYGNKETVELLLNKNSQLGYCRDTNDRNALHYAVESGKGEIVKLLLNKAPLLLYSTDKDGKIPLHYAVESGKSEIAELLLDKNPVQMFHPTKNNSVLYLAIKKGDEDTFKLLLKYMNSEQIKVLDGYGCAGLQWTIESGNIDMVKLILSHEFLTPKLFEVRNNKGETLLHLAVKDNKNIKTVKLLLNHKYMTKELMNATDKAGAAVLDYKELMNATDKAGAAVLEYAVKHNQTELASEITKQQIFYSFGQQLLPKSLIYIVAEYVVDKDALVVSDALSSSSSENISIIGSAPEAHE